MLFVWERSTTFELELEGSEILQLGYLKKVIFNRSDTVRQYFRVLSGSVGGNHTSRKCKTEMVVSCKSIKGSQ